MTYLHTILFPYFLYPGQIIVMSASVLMTVAIAMERYVAVHYPLDYNQVSMHQLYYIEHLEPGELGWKLEFVH